MKISRRGELLLMALAFALVAVLAVSTKQVCGPDDPKGARLGGFFTLYGCP